MNDAIALLETVEAAQSEDAFFLLFDVVVAMSFRAMRMKAARADAGLDEKPDPIKCNSGIESAALVCCVATSVGASEMLRSGTTSDDCAFVAAAPVEEEEEESVESAGTVTCEPSIVSALI